MDCGAVISGKGRNRRASQESRALRTGFLPSPHTTITLTLTDAASFSWDVAATGKPPLTISGPYSVTSNVLTLAGKDTPGGPLVGQVTLSDDKHMNFKSVGGPASDPGLQFAR